MVEKIRYDKMLELKIEEAKGIRDNKAIFVLNLKLDAWRGFKL